MVAHGNPSMRLLGSRSGPANSTINPTAHQNNFSKAQYFQPYQRALLLLRYGLITSREQGSSLVFALIFVLVVLATSLMVSNRGMLGMIGSFFNQDSKLARDAADIGILRAAMLLNEPQNRILLAKADLIDTKSGNDIAAFSEFENPCQSLPPDVVNSTMGIKLSGSSSYPIIDIDDGSATNGIKRRFQIIGIRQSSIPDLETGQSGGISITVRGEAVSIKDNKVLSSSTITRELEVVPKCCGLSLGGPNKTFGLDNRKCDAGNPGLGLIAGTYYKGNGKFNTTGGKGITFTTPDGKAIDAVYCLDENAKNDCSAGGLNSGTGTDLVEVKPKLSDVPSMPAMPAGVSSCDGVLTGSCNIKINGNVTLSTADFANWGSNSTIVNPILSTASNAVTAVTTGTTTTVVPNILKCTGPKAPVKSCANKNDTYTDTISLTVTSTTTSTITLSVVTSVVTVGSSTTVVPASTEISNLKSHCFQNLESGVTVTYCSLNTLSKGSGGGTSSLNIDTTGGPIRFYFPNASATTTTGPKTTLIPVIDLASGNFTIYQTNVSGPTKYTDLIFYGIPRSELSSKCSAPAYETACQAVQFGGGTPATSSFFAYFPGGESTLIGTSTIEGVLWSNIISATGSPNFITSSSGIGSVLDMFGMADQTPDNSNSNTSILREYVTRFTRRFSFFG
jgi:hypothetical protein